MWLKLCWRQSSAAILDRSRSVATSSSLRFNLCFSESSKCKQAISSALLLDAMACAEMATCKMQVYVILVVVWRCVAFIFGT